MKKNLLLVVLLVLACISSAACGGGGSVTGSDPTPSPVAEASIRWISTSPAAGTILSQEQQVRTTVTCSVPERYKGHYVACVGGPSADGQTITSGITSDLLNAPLDNQQVSSKAMMPPNGPTQTDYIVVEVRYYSHRIGNDLGDPEILARNAVSYALHFQ